VTADHVSTHRSLLFTVAYEMLGSAADAEDVVQEVWLRWADGDRADVLDPRAYLVRITTRLALNKCAATHADARTTSAPGCPSRC
jgi:DNA-directed RNA polymerase specialized sigma24 family protein